MDSPIPDERLWNIANSSPDKRYPDLAANPTSPPYPHPQGCQQQFHDRHEQLYYKFITQEPPPS